MEGQGQPRSRRADQMHQRHIRVSESSQLEASHVGDTSTPDPGRKGNEGAVASLVLAKTVLTPQDHFCEKFKPGPH